MSLSKRSRKHHYLHLPGAPGWNAWHMLTSVVLAVAIAATMIATQGWGGRTAAIGAVLIAAVGLILYRVRRSLEQLAGHIVQVKHSAIRAERHYIDVLRRVIQCVEARDKYTIGHSERVGRLTRSLAERLAFSAAECETLQIAAQLHDIGMVAIPEHILTDGARIGADGFRAVKKHSEIGFEVLEPLESLREMLPAVRHHHERMNGTGYPAGLAGEDIPLSARILAVADAYDAMTHDRPYRSAMTGAVAVAELRRCSPAGYDPRCVEALSKIMCLPEGSEVHEVHAGVR